MSADGSFHYNAHTADPDEILPKRGAMSVIRTFCDFKRLAVDQTPEIKIFYFDCSHYYSNSHQ